MDATLSALLVLVRTPHVRHYLEQTEPKVLEQVLAAIEELEAVRLAGGLSLSVIAGGITEWEAANQPVEAG